jgi:hypothetical protein
MSSDAWKHALLGAGIGMLGGGQGAGALSGLQMAQQAGQSERDHMLQMARVQQGVAAAAMEKRKYMADLMAQRQEMEEKAKRQGMIKDYAGGIDDERKRAEFMLRGPEQYFSARDSKEPAAMSAYEKAQLGLKYAERDDSKKVKKQEDLQKTGQQGHYEAIAARLPEDQRAMFWANPKGYVDKSQEKTLSTQNDDFSTEVKRILQANPQLAQTEGGVRRAQNIALGNIKTATDPVYGGTSTYNLATSQGQDVTKPIPEMADIQGADADGVSGATIQDISTEVGLGPMLQDFWSRSAGQLDESAVDKKRAQLSTKLKFVKTVLRSALASSPRGAVWELQQIDEILPDETAILESSGRAAESLKATKDLLRFKYNYQNEQLRSGQLDPGTARQMIDSNVQIQSAIKLLPDADDLNLGQEAGQPEMTAPVMQAATELGVEPSLIMQAAQEAGVPPEQIIEKLRAR